MSTNCERRRDVGAVQLAESTSSYSTSAVRCCAHSEQVNMSRLQPGVPAREMSYSRIARPQLGQAGVLPTGCSDDLNKLNWGMAPLLALPTNSKHRNLFRDWFATVCVSSWRELMSALPLESGHLQRTSRCQLSANSGHASPHYSITSSAMESTPAGMARRSALAVVRLMTNSNLVDCSTGRSAGFAPLRIRPV